MILKMIPFCVNGIILLVVQTMPADKSDGLRSASGSSSRVSCGVVVST
jgi:hypothetical protein